MEVSKEFLQTMAHLLREGEAMLNNMEYFSDAQAYRDFEIAVDKARATLCRRCRSGDRDTVMCWCCRAHDRES